MNQYKMARVIKMATVILVLQACCLQAAAPKSKSRPAQTLSHSGLPRKRTITLSFLPKPKKEEREQEKKSSSSSSLSSSSLGSSKESIKEEEVKASESSSIDVEEEIIGNFIKPSTSRFSLSKTHSDIENIRTFAHILINRGVRLSGWYLKKHNIPYLVKPDETKELNNKELTDTKKEKLVKAIEAVTSIVMKQIRNFDASEKERQKDDFDSSKMQNLSASASKGVDLKPLVNMLAVLQSFYRECFTLLNVLTFDSLYKTDKLVGAINPQTLGVLAAVRQNSPKRESSLTYSLEDLGYPSKKPANHLDAHDH